MENPSITELAKAIRPELRALVGTQAAELDARLEELLLGIATAEQEILRLLHAAPATREWSYAFLRGGSASGLREAGSAYFPMAGDGGEVLPDTCACPERPCAHRWYRRAVGQTVPTCPDHGQVFVRVNELET